MASILANLPTAPLAHHKPQPLLTAVGTFSVPTPKERGNHLAVVVKAMGESSDSSTSLSVVKSVQNVWDKPEDRVAIIGLGFAGVVALWASANLVTAIDKVPLIPSAMELIGILFSAWFTYRYLLFKPDREELFQSTKKSISDILGQETVPSCAGQ